MSELDNTTLFNVKDGDQSKNIQVILKKVYSSLDKNGYRPINQIVGYLISGDPAYIPRTDDARNIIKRYERDEIIEELVKNYLSEEK